MSAVPVRGALASMAVALAGVVAFGQLTHGFTVLTAETARRAAIELSPITVPALQSIDQDGRSREMLSDPDHAGPAARVTIITFIYTRCVTLCSALGSMYEQLQAEIRARSLDGRVRLLTVSFDPRHDTPTELALYAQRMHADPRIWTVISPTQDEQLSKLLTAFGVVVIPAPPDQFQHNAAFHVVDQTGRLVRIVDLSNPQGALDAARLLTLTRGPVT